MEWQPIETAPTNKTILLWNPSYGTPVTGHVLVEGFWGVFVPGTPMLFQPQLSIAPTKWMPLPPPPVHQEEEK